MTESIHHVEGPVYYRCKRCGKVAAPHQVEPGDDGLPREDCGCYMGPKWVRGIFVKSQAQRGKVTYVTHDEVSDMSIPREGSTE